jgi:hypothetical protein
MTESLRSTFRKIRLIVIGDEAELPLARAVLASLSRAQSHFQLSLDETPTPLGEDAALSPEQFVELVERRREDGDEMLFGITGHANTANFFGWKDTNALTAFCSRSGWPYLSNLPEQAFVAFQCAAYALRLSAPGLRLHDEMNGCVQDFCADKGQFNFKLRTADICYACREVVEHALEPERLDAIIAMLEQARRVALGRTDPDVVVRPVTLAERVDQSYPFPIAYSFRKMQVEADPTHRWRLLLDAADITLRYLAVVGMALTSEVGLDGHPRACTDAYRKLDKPSLGDWRSLVSMGGCSDRVGGSQTDRGRGSVVKGLTGVTAGRC